MSATISRRQGRPPAMEDMRGHILDVAAEVFARGGYDGSSLAELAQACNMTKPAIYHYYRSKQDILDALIMRTLEGLLAHGRAELGPPGDAAGDLKRLMIAHARYFDANFHAFSAMLSGFGSMATRLQAQDARRVRGEYEEMIRDCIRRAIAEGSFREVDVADAGRAILSLLNWMGRWYRPDGPRRAEEFAADYYEMFVRGLHA